MGSSRPDFSPPLLRGFMNLLRGGYMHFSKILLLILFLKKVKYCLFRRSLNKVCSCFEKKSSKAEKNKFRESRHWCTVFAHAVGDLFIFFCVLFVFTFYFHTQTWKSTTPQANVCLLSSMSGSLLQTPVTKLSEYASREVWPPTW